MLSPLAWLGRHATWVLAIGVVAALVVPGPGALLAGTLPFWVTVLYGLAMTRIDMAAVARRAVGPRRLVRNLGLLALLMGATPAAFWAVGTVAGLPLGHVEALVYTSAGPPLGSATAFCLILGLDAAFAIELTVLGSLIAPVTMPLVSRLLLGEAVPIDAAEMTLRLALLIGTGTVGALVARRLLGAARIQRHAHAFDGMGTILLICFLFPLFHGVPEMILAAPWLALGTLGLAIAVNLGAQVAALAPARAVAGPATGGAVAIIWGNRNAALALASLPPDPLLTLYVALYQFPMYFTPLVMRPLVTRA